MIVTLIGMSGIGKTYWSQKLEKRGFKRFCCDDLIENKLSSHLKSHGFKGLKDVARWMGMPYDKQYPDTSSLYLHQEAECIREIVCYLMSNSTIQENIVIDTTGSFIYIDQKIINTLREMSIFVYLEGPKEMKKKLYERYIESPKPIIWGNLYRNEKNDTPKNALKKCYPQLLDFRTKKYKSISDYVMAPQVHNRHKLTVAQFLSFIPTHHAVGKHQKHNKKSLSGCSFL